MPQCLTIKKEVRQYVWRISKWKFKDKMLKMISVEGKNQTVNIRTQYYNNNIEGDLKYYSSIKPEETIKNWNKSNGRGRQVLGCFPHCLIKLHIWNSASNILSVLRKCTNYNNISKRQPT